MVLLGLAVPAVVELQHWCSMPKEAHQDTALLTKFPEGEQARASQPLERPVVLLGLAVSALGAFPEEEQQTI